MASENHPSNVSKQSDDEIQRLIQIRQDLYHHSSGESVLYMYHMILNLSISYFILVACKFIPHSDYDRRNNPGIIHCAATETINNIYTE